MSEALEGLRKGVPFIDMGFRSCSGCGVQHSLDANGRGNKEAHWETSAITKAINEGGLERE